MLDGLPKGVEAVEIREVNETGRVLHVRGRLWGTLDAFGPAGAVLSVREQQPTEELDALSPEPRDDKATEVRIVGIASSTGVDSYGTEMTANALTSMARQMTEGRGVSYAPTHAEREWHQVVGRTVFAEVQPVDQVLNAADRSEPAAVLVVESIIDTQKPRGAALVQSLRNGEPIGQSIGAWFTSIFVQEDGRTGDIERIFVDDLELDHLAGTRTPSNGDSTGLRLRENMSVALRSLVAPEPEPEPEPEPDLRAALLAPVLADPEMALRHVLAVEVEEAQVSVTLAKAANSRESGASGESWDLVGLDARNVIQVADGEDAVTFVFLREGEDVVEESATQEGTNFDREAEQASAEPSADRDVPAAVPDDASAESITSEARAEDPHDNEDTMDLEALRAMLGEVVGEKLADTNAAVADLSARVALVEVSGPAIEPDTNETPDTRDAEELDAAQRKIAELEARQAASDKLVDRLLRQPVRATRAFGGGAHMAAVLEGDFAPMIERAREVGDHPATVRVNSTSRALQKVRDAFDNPNTRIHSKDVRDALRDAFRAFEADGGFDAAVNPWKG